jgi:nucleosome binding factor SPN SPT16 subunit
MGLEFKEPAYVLSAKNARVLRSNMVFNLTVGFQDLKDDGKLAMYTIHIADTVKVGQERGVTLTDAAREAKDCLFFFQSDEPTSKPKLPKDKPKGASPKKQMSQKMAAGHVLRTQTRSGGGAEVMQTTRTKIYPHQVELHARRQTEGTARFESGAGGTGAGEGKTWKRFVSYKGEAGLPSEVTEPKVSFFLIVSRYLGRS